MCNCRSANNPNGKDKQYVLKLPEWCDPYKPNRWASLDHCINNVIRYLLKNKIETLNCCCGHNKTPPSVVVGENVDIKKVFEFINEVDKRNWTVSRWELVDYKSANEYQGDVK